MRLIRVVLSLLLMLYPLLIVPPAHAATGFVQECTGGVGSAGTTQTCVFGVNVTAGNLVACFSTTKSTTATISFSDTASNTYTNQSTYYTDTTNTERGIGSYAINVTGGFTTITATSSVSTNHRGINCHEVSGAKTTSPADGYVGQQLAASQGTDTNTSTSITTTVNGDYVGAWTYDSSGGCVSQTAGTNYTGHTLTGCQFPYSEHLIQSTAGSIAGTFSPNCCTNEPYITIVQAFKAAVTASGAGSRMLLQVGQ